MHDKQLLDLAKVIARQITVSDDAPQTMGTVMETLIDEGLDGGDIGKILIGVVLHIARTLDVATLRSFRATLFPLVLLYPHKSMDELKQMTGELLAGDIQRQPTVHAFVFTKRG